MSNDYSAYDPTDKPQVTDEATSLVAPDISVISVLDWLDTQISEYSDPSLITGVNPSSNAEDLKTAVLLAQSLIKDYKQKRNEFINLFSDLIPEERRSLD